MATRCRFRGRRGILWDVLRIDGSLARNIDFEVANLKARAKTRRKTSILKLQSVKIEEVSHERLVLMLPHLSSQVSGFPMASPCLWGKLQNLSFSKVSKQVVMSFCVAGAGTLHSTLRTLHSTLHTLHSTTLHFAHSSLHTLHFTLYTPHSTLDTLHSTLYTPHFILHTPHSTIYTLHSSLHTLHFTLCTFHSPFTLYTLHSTLHNLHFGLHTLNFALHTLHSTVSTPHSTLYTPHSSLLTPHFILYTPHFAVCTLHSSLHTLHSTLYTPHSSLYTPHSTLYSFHSTLHTLHSTLSSPRFTLHTLHSTLHTLHSTLYTPHFPLYTPHSTLYTPHSTLYTPHSALYALHSIHSTLYTVHSTLQTGNRGNLYIQDCPNKLLQKIVLSDCISINIPVSIRVRGLHLVLLPTHFQPLRCTHFPSAAVRAAKLAHPSGFFSPPISSHSLAPTPSAAVHAILRTHFRPQPSAQPSSLITSGFFSPTISSHSLAPTPSAAVRAILPTHFPSAAVRAAKLAHHQRLLLPTHFQPLRCTHAVRSRPRSSPQPFPVRSQARSLPAASSPHPFPTSPLHPRRPQPSAQFSAPICRPQPSAQPRSLITSSFFSPPISSHSVAPTPSAAVHAVLRTHLLSAAVRAAKLAHHQRLLLPTHFQPPPCTHAVRSRPRISPHPFAVRSRPRSQGRSSPAASSPHPFPATPLHPRRPQPSAQFSAPICRPPPISSHSVAPTPSAAIRAILRTHLLSAAVRAAKLAHHQRLLLPTHFQLLPCTHAVCSRPRSSPHPFAVRSRPRSQGRSSPAASSPHPFPATLLHPRRPQPSTQFSAPICCPQPSAQPRSLITSGFFSPPISSHSVAPTPSAAVHAVLRTHLPSAALRAAKVAHHQRLLLSTRF